MSLRIPVTPKILLWAQSRSGRSDFELESRFKGLVDWKAGIKQPTIKQLESFAHATYTPVGYLFLQEPPQEKLPIPDFRTFQGKKPDKPSAKLLDTIYQCQLRQEWYKEYALINKESLVPFVESLNTKVGIVAAASQLRQILSFDIESRGRTWSDAYKHLIDEAENLGALVMISGVVGSNTKRKLDPKEFRGFAISDKLAPLIFINGADTKAAQIFTLAHEIVHLCLGQSAVSNSDIVSMPNNKIEQWCNKVAAEFLVPADTLANFEFDLSDMTLQLEHLAHKFKVSTLVILRRLYDTKHMNKSDFQVAHDKELKRLLLILERRGGSGGDFYNTQPVRISKRFSRALIGSTLEGQTLYREAFQMLGLKKVSTFNELAHRLGYM